MLGRVLLNLYSVAFVCILCGLHASVTCPYLAWLYHDLVCLTRRDDDEHYPISIYLLGLLSVSCVAYMPQ